MEPRGSEVISNQVPKDGSLYLKRMTKAFQGDTELPGQRFRRMRKMVSNSLNQNIRFWEKELEIGLHQFPKVVMAKTVRSYLRIVNGRVVGQTVFQ